MSASSTALIHFHTNIREQTFSLASSCVEAQALRLESRGLSDWFLIYGGRIARDKKSPNIL
jgi:hypothetical protein